MTYFSIFCKGERKKKARGREQGAGSRGQGAGGREQAERPNFFVFARIGERVKR